MHSRSLSYSSDLPEPIRSRDTVAVPVKCTCGASPPDDARFCHKCGRPLYEIPSPEPAPPPEPDPVAQVLPSPAKTERDINFRNRAAVRAGLLAALICSLLIFFVPMPMYVSVVWAVLVLTGTGFASVWLYRRRTGEDLSVGKGARMGWMTGVFCFAFAAVMITFAILAISGDNEVSQTFREQIQAQGGSGIDPDEVLGMVLSPIGILFILLSFFFFFTVLPTVGGAMGAKVLEKE